MNTETKVGAITLAGLALLAGMLMYLGGISFGDKGYPVQAVFGQVNGLRPGNLVRYAGVEVGKVTFVRVLPVGVAAELMLNQDVKVPAGSKFTIGADGLLGEKFVNIVPPREVTRFLAPGEQINGEDIQGLDQFMESANVVLSEVRTLVASLNDVLGDEKVKAALKASALNTSEITANLNKLTAALASLAVDNKHGVDEMVANLSAVSVNLKNTTARVDAMLADIDNNGQTAKELRETITALKETSNRVEKMAAALEGTVTSPETARNIKETLANAREASARANKMLGQVGDIKTEFSVESLYNTDTHNYKSSAGLRISHSPQDFAVIGVSDIGEKSKLNLQMGKSRSALSQRFGIMENKAGVGLDAQLSDQLRLSVDVFDPNDVRVKLRTQYEIGADTFLVGQADDINKRDDKTSYFGIRRVF